MRRLGVFVVVLCDLALCSSAWGLGAGSFDPTFNGGVPLALDLAQTAPHGTFLRAVTVDPFGRYVAAGSTTDAKGHNALVMSRVLPQGLLDPSFGANGAEVVQVGQGAKPYSAAEGEVSLGSTGLPLVGVYATTADGRTGMGVLRLGENGLPDLGFGSGGSLLVEPVEAPAYTTGGPAAVAPDGSVYETGGLESEPKSGANRKLVVAKFDTNGSIISSYGTSGFRYISFSQDETDTGTYSGAILPHADGTVLLAGTTLSSDSRQQLYVAKLNANGTPDATFGTTGTGYTDVQAREPGASDSGGAALAEAPDGSIYVAGSADLTSNLPAISVTRFGAGGALDTTFGSMGTRRLQLGIGSGRESTSSAEAVVVQPDGKVIVVGTARGEPNIDELAIVRLNTDGSLDTSFGTGGIDLLQLSTPASEHETYGAGAALTPDGKLLVVGSYSTPGQGSVGFLARVLLSPLLPSPTSPGTSQTGTGAPAPPVSPGAPAPPVPPVISGVHQSASTWREGSKPARISSKKKPPVGTTISFTLNEQAAVSLGFTQQVAGRQVGHSCLPPSRKNAVRKACQRTVTLGTLAFTGHSTINKVAFQGRISRSNKLRPGHYTLVLTASNSAGARSAPTSLSFTIVR